MIENDELSVLLAGGESDVEEHTGAEAVRASVSAGVLLAAGVFAAVVAVPVIATAIIAVVSYVNSFSALRSLGY